MIVAHKNAWLRRHAIAASVSVPTLLVALGPVLAASFWSGGSGTDWFNAMNWTWEAVVPDINRDAWMDGGSPNSPVIGASTSAAASTLYVGVTNGGALSVAGYLTSRNTNFGFNSTGQGSATIATGAMWSNSNVFIVGDRGAGTVTLNGLLSTQNAILGGSAPGNTGEGTMVVDGTGSSWTDGGRVVVGNFGTGTVTIKNGGLLTSGGGLIGSQSTGIGTVNVNGGSWVGSHNGIGTIQVGNEGQGQLNVTAGGNVSSIDGYVGSENGSIGTATVDGLGSTWTNSGDLFVSHNDGSVGTLTIRNGGLATGGFLQIGNLHGSDGTVTVSNAGSSLTARSDLNVGWHGAGTLNVTNGGTVTSTGSTSYVHIANEGDATGTALVSGSGSVLSSANFIVVGTGGVGTLTLQNGGQISATNQIGIGQQTGSTGTLIIGAAANASAVAAGTIDSPTIRFGSGNGRIVFNATDPAYTLSSRIRGAGVIEVYNGNLALTATNNTYSGGTHVVGGVLSLGASQAAGTGAITLENGAAIAYATGIDVNNSLVINGLVDLSVSGAATQRGNVTIANGASWRLSGNGTLNFLGVTTSASGSTNVANDAALSVNGVLQGAVNIGSRGMLKGNGTVGTTTVASGGTVAPGNSIGTLNVAGDITFSPGSTYQVEANPAGGSDKIVANGTAFINGGNVAVAPSAGLYAPNTSYTILTANNVNGRFMDVTSTLAFLTPVLSYDAQNVYLRLNRNGANFASVGQTPNQTAIAQSVDSSNVLTIPNLLVGLTADDARRALNSLSGEIYASVSGFRIEQGRLPREIMLERMDDGLDASRRALSIGSVTTGGQEPESNAWATAYGLQQGALGDGNAAATSGAGGGLAIGAETALDDWRVGIMLQNGTSAFRVADRGSDATSFDYGVGVYAGTRWGQTQLSVGGAYTRHDVSTRRSMTIAGVSSDVSGSYSGATAQVFGAIQHDLDFGSTTLSPFAGLVFVNDSNGAVAETGGAAALNVDAGSNSAFLSALGLKAEHDVVLDTGASVRVSASVAWSHAFAEDPKTGNAIQGGQPVSITGNGIPKDALQLGGGVRFEASNGIDMGLNYDGRFDSRGSNHTIKASLSGRF